jgi:hypothetical protein
MIPMLESKKLQSAQRLRPNRSRPWEVFMSNKLNQTQKLFRTSGLATGDRGHNALVDRAETGTFELMSTQMMQTIMGSNDVEANENLREIAAGESGLVARDVEKNRFEIISDQELQKILDSSDNSLPVKSTSSLVDEELVEAIDGEDALDIVSTQMLRIAFDLNDD